MVEPLIGYGFHRRLEHTWRPGSAYFVTWGLDGSNWTSSSTRCRPDPDGWSGATLPGSSRMPSGKGSGSPGMKWGAWALMPNHVHIALRPLGDQDLAAAVRSIKGSSAHAANRLLHRSGSRFWASDYFGRRIRDRDHEGRVTRYIAAFSENLHFQAARPLATGTDRDVRMIR